MEGVVEAGPTWGWVYDTLSQAGVEMVLAHPRVIVPDLRNLPISYSVTSSLIKTRLGRPSPG